jgi:prophage regulatory protein
MKIIRPNQLQGEYGISKSTAYRLAKEGKFPRPRKLTPKASGWIRDELDAWIKDRPAAV